MIVEQVRGRRWGREEEGGGKREEEGGGKREEEGGGKREEVIMDYVGSFLY